MELATNYNRMTEEEYIEKEWQRLLSMQNTGYGLDGKIEQLMREKWELEKEIQLLMPLE